MVVTSMASLPRVNALVLVVEDDRVLRGLVTRVITAAGFDVMESANADEALGKLERHAGIRIVFTDVDMPGSMNGLTLANAVRGRWPPMKIIVASGQRPSAQELPPRGVFLPKPYDGAVLVETLRAMAA